MLVCYQPALVPDAESLVRLEICSHFDMLDFVQLVCDRMVELAALDEDSGHWVGVAVRESVINAIKHGNREEIDKHVLIEFSFTPATSPSELVVRVVDQGEGFDPEDIPDPRDPENVLKSSGRGLFFMRSFMDELVVERAPGGGMQVRMVKKLTASAEA